jgi:hypothetical protein
MPTQIPATSDETLPLTVTGPAGLDLTRFTPQVALTPDGVPGEPADADYHPFTWTPDGKVAFHLGAMYGTAYPAGLYLVWVRLDTGSERPVIAAGRLRIGDTRL